MTLSTTMHRPCQISFRKRHRPRQNSSDISTAEYLCRNLCIFWGRGTSRRNIWGCLSWVPCRCSAACSWQVFWRHWSSCRWWSSECCGPRLRCSWGWLWRVISDRPGLGPAWYSPSIRWVSAGTEPYSKKTLRWSGWFPQTRPRRTECGRLWAQTPDLSVAASAEKT